MRQHVASGRLSVVGGMVSMMDCDVPDGEVFARQLLYGQRWLERNLGKHARVGWLIDNYGYTPQLPQLLRSAGMDALEICLWWAPSGFLANRIPRTEFRWLSLDGSEVLVHVALPNYTGPRLPAHHAYDDPPASFDPHAKTGFLIDTSVMFMEAELRPRGRRDLRPCGRRRARACRPRSAFTLAARAALLLLGARGRCVHRREPRRAHACARGERLGAADDEPFAAGEAIPISTQPSLLFIPSVTGTSFTTSSSAM